jgi:hypothetical protein
MKRTHPALLTAVGLLCLSAARLAYFQYTTGQESDYLISGYRGGLIISLLACICLGFPRVGRWIACIYFLFVALVVAPTIIGGGLRLQLFVAFLVYAGTAFWLLLAKAKAVEPPPLSKP